MRILHVTKKYPAALGGDSFYVSALEEQSRAKGNDVRILACNTDEIAKKSNVTVFGIREPSRSLDRIGAKRLASLLHFLLLFPLVLIRAKPDIVHFHAVELGLFGSWFCLLFRIPHYLTLHCIQFPYRDQPLSKRVIEYVCLQLSFYSRIISVDAASIGTCRRHNIRNVVYIPTGTAQAFVCAQRKKREASGPLRLLFTGRLEAIKGLDGLLLALRTVLDSGIDVRCSLVGEGSREHHLRATADSLGLGTHVSWLGPLYERPAVVECYRSHDVFVLPSLREWCPLVVFEAMASGLLLVASRVGSIPFICTDGFDALLFEPGAATELAGIIADIHSDPENRRRIAGRGRELVRKQYLWEHISDQIERVYTGTANG